MYILNRNINIKQGSKSKIYKGNPSNGSYIYTAYRLQYINMHANKSMYFKQ